MEQFPPLNLRPAKPPLPVPEAEMLPEFLSNAKDAWNKKHPELKKHRGKKSVAKEALTLICESWLELRHGE
jgi:hypothetical protein